MPHHAAPSVSAEQNMVQNDSTDQPEARNNANFSAGLLSHLS